MFTYTFEYALQHGINVYSKFWNKYLVAEVSRYVDKSEYLWVPVNSSEYFSILNTNDRYSHIPSLRYSQSNLHE